MDKPPTITYGLVTGQLKLVMTGVIAYCLGKGYLTAADATMLTTVLTGLGALAIPFAWSWYSNAGTRKVAANAVVVIPSTPPGQDAPSAGQSIVGKVVAALLCAIMLNAFMISTTRAQSLNLFPKPASAIPAGFLKTLQGWISSDIDGAIALSKSIPDLPDPVGEKCWTTFKGVGEIVTQHPLPATLKLATDIQAARLLNMALKKVCAEPACSQVWNDIQNQVKALAPVTTPFTLASICSKVL